MLFPCLFFTEIQFGVLCSIGNVFDLMGKPEKALENYNKSLAIKKKVLGCEHLDTASTKNKYADYALHRFLVLTAVLWCGIAAVYYAQGKHDDALTIWQDVLQVRVKILGLEHPDLAATYSNIGAVYRQQAKHLEALDMYRKALAIDEKVHGPDHLLVADTKHKCARCCCPL